VSSQRLYILVCTGWRFRTLHNSSPTPPPPSCRWVWCAAPYFPITLLWTPFTLASCLSLRARLWGHSFVMSHSATQVIFLVYRQWNRLRDVTCCDYPRPACNQHSPFFFRLHGGTVYRCHTSSDICTPLACASPRIICIASHRQYHRLFSFVPNILCFFGIYCLKADSPWEGHLPRRQPGVPCDGAPGWTCREFGCRHFPVSTDDPNYAFLCIWGGGE
jgi:hypothetical protein